MNEEELQNQDLWLLMPVDDETNNNINNVCVDIKLSLSCISQKSVGKATFLVKLQLSYGSFCSLATLAFLLPNRKARRIK